MYKLILMAKFWKIFAFGSCIYLHLHDACRHAPGLRGTEKSSTWETVVAMYRKKIKHSHYPGGGKGDKNGGVLSCCKCSEPSRLQPLLLTTCSFISPTSCTLWPSFPCIYLNPEIILFPCTPNKLSQLPLLAWLIHINSLIKKNIHQVVFRKIPMAAAGALTAFRSTSSKLRSIGRCSKPIREQRARLYIIWRCTVLLLCWQD